MKRFNIIISDDLGTICSYHHGDANFGGKDKAILYPNRGEAELELRRLKQSPKLFGSVIFLGEQFEILTVNK